MAEANDGEYASEAIWAELRGLHEIAKKAWAVRTCQGGEGDLDEALDFYANTVLPAHLTRIVKAVPYPTAAPSDQALSSGVEQAELVEVVAARVHEAWVNQKRAAGFTSRKSEAGEELMVPYAELTEAAKDLDRVTVRAVLAALHVAPVASPAAGAGKAPAQSGKALDEALAGARGLLGVAEGNKYCAIGVDTKHLRLLVEAAEAGKTQAEWVAVSERLPPPYERIVFVTSPDDVRVGERKDYGWEDQLDLDEHNECSIHEEHNVTHWMLLELPPPPSQSPEGA